MSEGVRTVWGVAGVVMPERSAEELGAMIGGLHTVMAGAHADLLVVIGEHDRVEAWRGAGARNEEDFLCRRLGVGWRTARDWVRAARVVARDAGLWERYAEGMISWDKLNHTAQLISARSAGVVKRRVPRPAGVRRDTRLRVSPLRLRLR